MIKIFESEFLGHISNQVSFERLIFLFLGGCGMYLKTTTDAAKSCAVLSNKKGNFF